jgi:hypothetical protein
MDTPVSDAVIKGRREVLEAVRMHLASILDGESGHRHGCECQCGAVWDAGKVAPIVRELREVIRELDELPSGQGGESDFERAQRERDERRRLAQQSRAVL